MREPKRAQIALDENHIEKRSVLVDDEGRWHSAGRWIELCSDPPSQGDDSDFGIHLRISGHARGRGFASEPIETCCHGSRTAGQGRRSRSEAAWTRGPAVARGSEGKKGSKIDFSA
jgi:hypothetical protein